MKHANIAVFVPHNGCPCRCSFCNQRTITGRVSQPGPEDVEKACVTAAINGCEGKSTQLAFFGGSFTAIDRDYMLSLLDAAQPFIENGLLSDGIRISTRPDFIDDEILDILISKGVKAVELGAQSMDEEVLALNDRGHTAAQVISASRLIKQRGLELGLQMMTGLYGSNDDKDIMTAKSFTILRPETVRIYPTVVLEGTALADYMRRGIYKPQELDDAVRLCSRLLTMFEDAGIRVIRLGLHAEENIEKNRLAGAYHPALRELCESEIFYEKALEALNGRPAGRYALKVSPSDISKMTGQKKKNIARLANAGYICRVIPGDLSGKYAVEAITENVPGD